MQWKPRYLDSQSAALSVSGLILSDPDDDTMRSYSSVRLYEAQFARTHVNVVQLFLKFTCANR